MCFFGPEKTGKAVEREIVSSAAAVNEWSPLPKKAPPKAKAKSKLALVLLCLSVYIWQMSAKWTYTVGCGVPQNVLVNTCTCWRKLPYQTTCEDSS